MSHRGRAFGRVTHQGHTWNLGCSDQHACLMWSVANSPGQRPLRTDIYVCRGTDRSPHKSVAKQALVRVIIQGRELNGRSGEIRTHDPCLPKTVLYQAELHSDRGARDSGVSLSLQEGIDAQRSCIRKEFNLPFPPLRQGIFFLPRWRILIRLAPAFKAACAS